jgi:hypothetical protein
MKRCLVYQEFLWSEVYYAKTEIPKAPLQLLLLGGFSHLLSQNQSLSMSFCFLKEAFLKDFSGDHGSNEPIFPQILFRKVPIHDISDLQKKM